jgi:FKBP-type peptidyl-prolyl cis-trans isomerase 2
VEIEDVSEKLSESVGISDTSSDVTGVLNSEPDGKAVLNTVPSGIGFGALAEPKQNQSNEKPMPGTSQITVGARVAHSDPYTVAYSYQGTVESVTGDEVVVRWTERQGKPNERETYNFSDLRLLENSDK